MDSIYAGIRVFDLPLPAAQLHAHAKGKWQSKYAATRKARNFAAMVAHNMCQKPAGKCDIQYRFFVPDSRCRDESNLIQACKPYIDGLVDAGAIYRDDWKYLHISGISVAIDRERPRVELVVMEVVSHV